MCTTPGPFPPPQPRRASCAYYSTVVPFWGACEGRVTPGNGGLFSVASELGQAEVEDAVFGHRAVDGDARWTTAAPPLCIASDEDRPEMVQDILEH